MLLKMFKNVFFVHLNLRPVGGHAGTTAVLPPLEILLLVDWHQRLVEVTVHRLHADTGAQNTVESTAVVLARSRAHSPAGVSPLVVGDVEVSVDGEEGLLQKADPLPLLLLRLVKDGFHLLHVARRVGRHVLQNLLVVLFSLQQIRRNSLWTGYMI